MNDEPERFRDGATADGGTESLDESLDTEAFDRGQRAAPNEEDATALPDENREFLLESVRRMPLLWALRSGPASTSELLTSVDMSRSTVHRAINTLEGYDVIEEANGKYRLTSVGKLLAEETRTFSTNASTVLSLDKFLNSINGHEEMIPIEHFVDATVVRRRPRHPHCTIHRIIELLEEYNSVRMLSTVISPVYVDVGYREMCDGMQIEAIFDHEVMDLMLSEYPEKAHETVSNGNFTLHAHDGLPFELFIFDGKVGMAAHNENGNAEILIECEDPAAVDWAEDLYANYLDESDPVEL